MLTAKLSQECSLKVPYNVAWQWSTGINHGYRGKNKRSYSLRVKCLTIASNSQIKNYFTKKIKPSTVIKINWLRQKPLKYRFTQEWVWIQMSKTNLMPLLASAQLRTQCKTSQITYWTSWPFSKCVSWMSCTHKAAKIKLQKTRTHFTSLNVRKNSSQQLTC